MALPPLKLNASAASAASQTPDLEPSPSSKQNQGLKPSASSKVGLRPAPHAPQPPPVHHTVDRVEISHKQPPPQPQGLRPDNHPVPKAPKPQAPPPKHHVNVVG